MLENLRANERLIVALDVDSKEKALDLIDRLGNDVVFYKIGWQLFIRLGMPFVKEVIRQRHKKVFLDLKMSDIEQTIRNALESLPDTGIELLTIHGNGPTVEAARKGRGNRPDPKLLMLTALSSQDDVDMRDIYSNEKATIAQQVSNRASHALKAGSEGVIASGDSVRQLRKEFGLNFIIVTPGIRPEGFSTDDHKRSLTPYKAIMDGANYLVVGRPISQSRDPRKTALQVISEIQRAMDDLSKPHNYSATKNPVPTSYPAFA